MNVGGGDGGYGGACQALVTCRGRRGQKLHLGRKKQTQGGVEGRGKDTCIGRLRAAEFSQVSGHAQGGGVTETQNCSSTAHQGEIHRQWRGDRGCQLES